MSATATRGYGFNPKRVKYGLRKDGYYTWMGHRYPSVSTILDNLDKPGIPRWAARQVAAHVAWQLKRRHDNVIDGNRLALILGDEDGLAAVPWEVRDRKRDIGRAIHSIAERWSYTGEMPDQLHPAIRPWAEPVIEWIRINKPVVLMAEASVISTSLGYGGTLDWIIQMPQPDGGVKTLLVDFKTGRGTWPTHALQLAAYRHANFVAIQDGDVEDGVEYPPETKRVEFNGIIGHEIPMPKVDGGAILSIQPRGCKLLEWDCDKEELDAFMSLKRTWQWLSLKKEATEISLIDPTLPPLED